MPFSVGPYTRWVREARGDPNVVRERLSFGQTDNFTYSESTRARHAEQQSARFPRLESIALEVYRTPPKGEDRHLVEVFRTAASNVSVSAIPRPSPPGFKGSSSCETRSSRSRFHARGLFVPHR